MRIKPIEAAGKGSFISLGGGYYSVLRCMQSLRWLEATGVSVRSLGVKSGHDGAEGDVKAVQSIRLNRRFS